MRWTLPVFAALGLLGAFYLGTRPRRLRPVVRVALELRAGDVDDAALAAGVEIALEERDYRGGGYRLASGHQIRHPNTWKLEFPEPRAHTMLHGVAPPGFLPGPDGPLLALDPEEEENAILAWACERGLARLARHGSVSSRVRELLARPEVVVLHPNWGVDIRQEYRGLRAAGFQGPVFMAFDAFWTDRASLALLDGARFMLAPLKPAPAEFRRRHPHPFAYAGYRGALRYADALDAGPGASPLQIALAFQGASIFAELREAPRAYEVQNGRLVPSN